MCEFGVKRYFTLKKHILVLMLKILNFVNIEFWVKFWNFRAQYHMPFGSTYMPFVLWC